MDHSDVLHITGGSYIVTAPRPTIRLQRLPHGVGLDLPKYETEGAAGFDLPASDEALIYPGERKMISTGFRIAVPAGYELQVRSRSGLSAKKGIIVLNAPGTIDEDYRGELFVVVFNTNGDEADPFWVRKGDRIAQGVLQPVTRAGFAEVTNLDETARGQGGFGSTGVGAIAA